MRTIARALCAVVLLGASAHAQTIIGESTYEDNFLHKPPPAPAAAAPATPGRAKADAPPAQDRSEPPEEHR